MKSNLAQLIKENPNLEMFAWVDSDVVDDDGGKWLGAFGLAEVREYTNVEPFGWMEQTIVFKNDHEDYYEHLAWQSDIEDGDEFNDWFDKKMAKMKWKKAIFVNVDTL